MMARFPGHAISDWGLLGPARAPFAGTRLAAAGGDVRAHDSHGDRE